MLIIYTWSYKTTINRPSNKTDRILEALQLQKSDLLSPQLAEYNTSFLLGGMNCDKIRQRCHWPLLSFGIPVQHDLDLNTKNSLIGLRKQKVSSINRIRDSYYISRVSRNLEKKNTRTWVGWNIINKVKANAVRCIFLVTEKRNSKIAKKNAMYYHDTAVQLRLIKAFLFYNSNP